MTAHRVAYVGSTLIDGRGGRAIRPATVLTQESRIVAVGEAASVPIPEDCEIVDCAGRFILPGLMDANVHLLPWPSWTYIEFLARYEHAFENIILEGAQTALAAGFTTVFDSMGPLDSLMAVRDRIASGAELGARMFVAGNIIGFRAVFTTRESMASASRAFQDRINARFEAGGGPELCGLSPTSLRAAIADYVSQGVDFVKYGATGDGAPVNSEIGQEAVLRFSPAQQRAIVEAVHAAGKTVQTHTTSAESLHIAVEMGNDLGQHASYTGPTRIYEETIDLMLARGYFCGTQWGPLTAAQKACLAENDLEGLSRLGHSLDNVENSLRLISAGVPQLLSTDSGTIDPDVSKDEHQWGGLGGGASLIGDAQILNALAMIERGMTPMQVVLAATSNIAQAYGVDAELGTLEPGKFADLVVLERDPLADVANLRSVLAVVKDGKLVEHKRLPTRRVLTSPGAMQPGAIRLT